MQSNIPKDTWKDLFDPFAEELISTPYPHYERLLAEKPIHWSPPLRSWIFARMEDVQTVLNDESFLAVDIAKNVSHLARRAGRDYTPLIRLLNSALLFIDGPRHRQDRRTIAKVINRINLTELKPVIQNFAASLASKISGAYEFDAISEFGNPLPQYVMAHIMGIPLSDVPVLSELLSQITLVFDLASLDVCDSVNAKTGEALELLKSRIAEGVRGNEETGLSIIYAGTSGPEAQRLMDAAASASFIFKVGSETTMGMMGLLFLTLIRQPRLRQIARDRRSLVPNIVSEVLRLESTVQRSIRIASETKVIGGTTIKAGDRLMLLLGAANRDPAAFDDPNNLSTDRKTVSDVVFGGGHHFCLGASLGRLEGCLALEQILDLPEFEQAGEERWFLGRSIRRLTRLPVRIKGAPVGRTDYG